MSRKYLYLFGLLLGLVFAITPILFGLRAKSITIQYAEKMMTGELETRSALITEAIRNMILGGDIISARAQLEIYKDRGYIEGYQLIKADQSLVESSGSSSSFDSCMVTAKDIYFSKGGPSWGVVKLYYSKNLLFMLQQAIRSVFFEKAWHMVLLLVVIMSLGFYGLWRTSGEVTKILDKYIVDYNVPATGRLFRKLWSPLLDTLRRSCTEYKKIRLESEQLKKHEAVAQTAQHIAHDLKGPIGVMATLLHASEWGEIASSLPTYRSALFRLQTMVSSLKEAAVNDIIRDSWCDFSLERVINEIRLTYNTIDIALIEQLPQQIRVDSAKMERAVANLLINAFEAGATKISCRQELNGSDLLIRVSDNGPGVPPNIMDHLFERGVTQGKHSGSGFGLAYVAQVARGHGGEASYERNENTSCFTLKIPDVVCEITLSEVTGVVGEAKPVSENPSTSAPNAAGRSIARQKSLLVFLESKSRQDEIAAQLRHPDLVVFADIMRVGEAFLVYTDDLGLIESCLQQNIRFLLDSSLPVAVMIEKLKNELSLEMEGAAYA